MKKFITLFLVLTGFVCSANAWDSAVLHYDGHWNDDTQYFTKISGNEFYFQLDGSVINQGSFYFRFAVKGEGPSDNLIEKEPDTDSHNVDQLVNRTAVSTDYNSWNDGDRTPKAWYIAQDPAADKVEIYIKYAEVNSKWSWYITAVPLYKHTISWDNSETSWGTVKAYTYDDNLGDHRKIEDLGAWNSGDALTLVDNKGTITFYGTNTAKAIFYNGSGDGQSQNLNVVNNGVYKGTTSYDPYAITVSAGSYGKATLCSEKALNFTGITAVSAYTITGAAEGILTTNKIDGKVKAETGLYIEGDANASADVPVVDYTTSPGDNMLIGINAKSPINQIDGDNTNFILTVNKNGGDVASPKFFKVNTAGNTVLAGKAYLQIPTASVGARESFWFNEETGVNVVKQEQALDGQAYNLAGQRVAQPQKGLYIVNGKKVIIK